MSKRSRQTIDVKWLKERLQYAIDHTDHLNEPITYNPDGSGDIVKPAVAARMVVAGILSDILMETGNYRGFNHRDWLEHGYNEWVAAGKPENNTPFIGDHSKVVYY